MSQLQAAMAVAMTEEERSGLASLCRDISELIALTKENLQSKQPHVSDDPLDQEYLLFKYGSGVTYHNAMVTRVDSDSTEGATDTSHIQVRVVFVNPTQQAMRLCPYYLDGKCRFTDDKCRYSHGQLVPLEPDFSLVKKGSRVLALGAGELWRCASVQELENSNGQRLCHVRFEESGDEALLELHSVLPIQGTSDSEDSSSEDDLNIPDEETLALANNILMNQAASTSSSSSPKTNNSPSNHQTDSSSRRGLNVRGFQLSEEIRRVEQEVSKLGQSASRLGQGSAGKAVSANLAAAKEKLEDLRRQQRSVEQESSRRRDRHKMTSF
ncbi:hypothetical protein B566_EDAN009789 [Ephemera danica]|nr:hypothetical protein B566_EDAN009789 [Ephemera danica]